MLRAARAGEVACRRFCTRVVEVISSGQRTGHVSARGGMHDTSAGAIGDVVFCAGLLKAKTLIPIIVSLWTRRLSSISRCIDNAR